MQKNNENVYVDLRSEAHAGVHKCACKFAHIVQHNCVGKNFNFCAYSRLFVYVFTIVSLVVIISLTFCLGTRLQEISYNSEEDSFTSKSKHWDYLAFCQLWPPTSCLLPESQNCTIPPNVNFWTVHGLWPSVYTKWDPEYCNKSWKFHIDEIESIRPRMDLYWPDCHDNEPVIDFWKHEWEKHGTCAASISPLGSQLKYFFKSLQLLETYNITKIMEEAGYTPSQDIKIPVVELLNNLHEAIGNNVTLKCIDRKKTSTPLLQSIYICFDKNLTRIDCFNEDSNCKGENLLYWPFPDNSTLVTKL